MKSLKYLVFILSFVICVQYKTLAQTKMIDACIYLTFQVDSLIKISQIQTDTGKKTISNFLLCFDDDKYLNSAELRQYSNEVLYKLLENHPKLILEIMSKNKNKIYWKIICDEISDPIIVSEVVVVKGIISQVKAISGYDNVKKDVLDALKKAAIYLTPTPINDK